MGRENSPSNKGIAALAALGLGLAECGYQHGTRDTAVDVCIEGHSSKIRSVVERDEDGRVVGNTIEHQWLIHTDKDMFENSNAWLSGKFNADELQYRIQDGHKYDIHYYGMDIGLGWYYRNILSVDHKGLCRKPAKEE